MLNNYNNYIQEYKNCLIQAGNLTEFLDMDSTELPEMQLYL